MADRRGAFSFVDRITAFEPHTRARGWFTVPRASVTWSPCLIAEAVGQLAAWVAMAAVDFRHRPVAALAGEVKVGRDVGAGSTIELGIEIEQCTDEAVAYNGWASVDGQHVITLAHCVGPMLSMEDFDDPRAVAARFEILSAESASSNGDVGDLVLQSPTVLAHERGVRVCASITVPRSAAFFDDHFPRNPMVPATLLLDAQIRLALDLATEAVGPAAQALLRPTAVRDVKVRSFIRPAQCIELIAETVSVRDTTVLIGLIARVDGKRVATARVEFAP